MPSALKSWPRFPEPPLIVPAISGLFFPLCAVFLTGTGAPDAVSAFRNSFMKPGAMAGGKAIGNSDPEGSAYHEAIQWAHDNGGKGRNIDVVMRKLEKEIQEEKDGARKAELRGYMAALGHKEVEKLKLNEIDMREKMTMLTQTPLVMQMIGPKIYLLKLHQANC